MASGLVTVLVLLGLLLVLVVGVAGKYNRLVSLRNRFENAFAQIDVQLKRRYDLIPNVVETARGYLQHERETLEAVVAARNRALQAEQRAAADPSDPGAMRGLAGAEGVLASAVGRLFAVMEAHPDLKANQNMLALQEELSSTENKIAFSRQAYNDAVMTYNTYRESFPNNILAGFFRFAEAELFEIEDAGHREAPQVSFS